MARPLRVEFAGALYHIVSRADGKKPIFRDDTDREKRLEWLSRTVDTYGWKVHAYVLMRNHDHFLVETPQPSLSPGMQYLNGGYTAFYNARHNRSGHLFRGRYKAYVIETPGHLAETSRHLHLNPVRLKAAEKPEDYQWSSYRGYHRAADIVDFVTYDDVLAELNADRSAARREYRKYVADAVKSAPPSPFDGATHGFIVGSDKFADKVRKILAQRSSGKLPPSLKKSLKAPAMKKIVDAVCDVFKVDAKSWKSGTRSDDLSRAVAAFVARRTYGYKTGEIAGSLGYSGSSGVTQAVKRVESRVKEIADKLNAIEKALA